LADACADVVVAMNILHLHPNPGEVIRECLRVLRPGGWLLCSWPLGTTGVAGVARAEIHLELGVATALARAVTRIAIHVTAVATGAVHRTDEADIVAALRAASSQIRWTELPAYAQTLAIIELPYEAGPAEPIRTPKEMSCPTLPLGGTSLRPTVS
jgi:SAM-dependent methyltransferase